MSKSVSKNKSLINLDACDCRWPIGDPRHADFHFCGAQQALGRPYCTEHLSLAFDAAKSRPQANLKVLPTFRRAA